MKSCTLSWDEKYPASYVFVPSPVFAKWKKEGKIVNDKE